MLTHNPSLDNAIFLCIGMVLGLALGWTFKSMQYAKQARDASQKVVRKLDESGWYKHRVSLVVVLIITAVAAIWTGLVNNGLHHSQKCTEQGFAQTLKSLNSRTSLTGEAGTAEIRQLEQFDTLLETLLIKPPATVQERTREFKRFQKRLHRYVAIKKQQREDQQRNPLPRAYSYRKCLEGK